MNTPNPQLSRINSFQSLTPSSQPVPPGSQPQQQPQQRIYNYQNTYIIQQITRFESLLSELTHSVEKFHPNPDISSALVSTVDQINNELVQLEIVHDLKKDQVTKQNSDNKQLNDSLRTILIQLNDCRKELNELPKLSYEESKALQQVPTDTVPNLSINLEETKQLLEYAMKLAKFSKIPRAFDGFLLPNNFVWPGDDNMRRGMLATASLVAHKLIKAENGEDIVDVSGENKEREGSESEGSSNKEEEEDDDDGDDDDDDIMEEESNKPDSNVEKTHAGAEETNMDLFDSEDEDD